MENVLLRSALVWALRFVPGSFLVPEDRKINRGFVRMGRMTKRKERKGYSLRLSVQTLSQMIPAISATKSPPWVHLSWGGLYLGFIEKACSFIYTLRLEPFLGAEECVQRLLTAPCSEERHPTLFSMAI